MNAKTLTIALVLASGTSWNALVSVTPMLSSGFRSANSFAWSARSGHAL
jgi:hypothetical protein